MTAQNLPVPFSYTQSLTASYKASRERLNSGKVQDTGIKCASASVRAAEWQNPVAVVPPPQIVHEPEEMRSWIARQKKKYWFFIVDEVDLTSGRLPSIDKIQRIVANHYDVTCNDIRSARRTADVVRPRQVGMYISKHMTLRSLPEIGRRFGGRDHTTVLHAVRKIDSLAKRDAELAQDLAELMIRIEKAGT